MEQFPLIFSYKFFVLLILIFVLLSIQLYQKCGQLEHSIRLLEDYIKTHPSEADLSVIDLLAAIFMESNAHDKALQVIEHANLAYYSGKELPLNLTIKEGICHAQLKNMEKAEVCCMSIFIYCH